MVSRTYDFAHVRARIRATIGSIDTTYDHLRPRDTWDEIARNRVFPNETVRSEKKMCVGVSLDMRWCTSALLYYARSHLKVYVYVCRLLRPFIDAVPSDRCADSIFPMEMDAFPCEFSGHSQSHCSRPLNAFEYYTMST